MALNGTKRKYKKSLNYISGRCPSGYHKRTGYTVKKTGTYVPPRCIRSTKADVKSKVVTRKCGPGEVRRAAYVRHFTSGIKKKGFTVKRKTGRTYRVYPKRNYAYVQSGCIKKKMETTTRKITSSGLRKGELRKHGYVYRLPSEQRHAALEKAVKEFTALGVYHKLDAVAKLSVRTAPEASAVFKADREWIKQKYGPRLRNE